MSPRTAQPYAVMLDVAGKLAVVVGGGADAQRAAKSLAAHKANVVVIAPDMPMELREAEAFHATHGFLADADEGRGAAAKFGGERAPTHFEGGGVEDFHAQTRDLLSEQGGQRGEGQRRPEGAGWAVEGP